MNHVFGPLEFLTHEKERRVNSHLRNRSLIDRRGPLPSDLANLSRTEREAANGLSLSISFPGSQRESCELHFRGQAYGYDGSIWKLQLYDENRPLNLRTM